MTLPAPTYDLVLLLDPQAEESTRAKIVSDTASAIQGQGELVRQDEWGERPLAYPIERHATAEYHLLQFHAGAPALLEALSRTLRITDGVLRHRLIKLARGTPDAPDMRAGSAAPRRSDAEEDAAEAPRAPEAAATESAAATDSPAAPEAPAPESPAPESPAAPEAPASAEAPAAEADAEQG
jgi:small subunit ribosomal protein S6